MPARSLKCWKPRSSCPSTHGVPCHFHHLEKLEGSVALLELGASPLQGRLDLRERSLGDDRNVLAACNVCAEARMEVDKG